jgi:diaminohydroxyphosphoribosylaminopyrimidine deaminase/5-amino-6-(5-phosphoribosylamino)uracil reductase
MTRPHVTLKLATSLDGRIATASGESQWITGEAARAQVHVLRAAHDAVVVGAGTALADDPLLTARTDPAPARQPWRVVFDRSGRLSPGSQLAQSTALGPVALVGAATGDPAPLEALGVAVIRTAWNATAVDMLAALAAKTGAKRVFLEGGGALAAAFVRESLVDELIWFRAPILIGGDGIGALGPLAKALADAPRFRRVSVTDLGEDLLETYVR